MTVQRNPETCGEASSFGGWNYTAISSNTTTVVKSGGGTYAGCMVTAPGTTWVVTIYDNTSASGTVLATFTAVAGANGVPPLNGIQVNNGITISATGTAGTLLVLWK